MNLRRVSLQKCWVLSSVSFKRAKSTRLPPPQFCAFETFPPYSPALFDTPGFTTFIPKPPYPPAQRDLPRLLLFSTPTPLEAYNPDPGPSLLTNLAKRMLNYVQLISTPTADTPGTTLLLHFDNKRYIIGHVGEGTQRALAQRKTSIAKIDSVFMAGPVTWRTSGGLMGLILTMADVLMAASKDSVKDKKDKKRAGVTPPTLRIHAGKNLAYFLAVGRRFILRKGLPLRLHEIQTDPLSVDTSASEPDWKDENMNVWYMLLESNQNQLATTQSRKRSHDEFRDGEITPPPASTAEEDQKAWDTAVTQMFDSDWVADALVETTLHQVMLPAKIFVRDEKGHLQEYAGLLPGAGEEVPDIPVLIRKPWPGSVFQSIPATQPSKQSMCYILKSHDRRGRFNPKAAEKLGVSKSDYRLLTDMKSVIAADGSVVTPDMVLGETVAGTGFAFVDLPDVSYVDALVSRAEWSDSQKMKGIYVIFWSLGPDVISDTRLQDFMRRMSTVKHIVTSPDNCPNMLALESPATQTYKLRCIDPDRFPLPSHSNETSLSGKSIENTSSLYETGRTGKFVQFAPSYLHQDDKIIPFPDIPLLAADGLDGEVIQMAAQARSKISDPRFAANVEEAEADIPNRDTEIVSLGTGSALPSKYRNVSATLVRVPGSGSYLFDAGENTLGQLRRVFGDELPSVLGDLKVIWISHLHADHHLGMVSVIKAWHEETMKSNPSSKLVIATHNVMMAFLKEYASAEPFGFHRLILVPLGHVENQSTQKLRRVFSNEECEQFGLEKIDACFVSHCYGSMATVFTFPSGLKIAYSGDCRPSNNFVRIGKGATILIHESTFDDELEGDAIAKKHSTMSEAIGVGRRMGARRVLLTHFSQRYQKVPIIDEDLDIHNDARPEINTLDQVILVAFDYMRVKLGSFREARAFLPAIQKMFEGAEQ